MDCLQSNQNNSPKNSTKRKVESFTCDVCMIDVTSLDVLECHKRGQKHAKKLRKLAETQLINESAEQKFSIESSVNIKPVETDTQNQNPPVKGFLQQLYDLSSFHRLKLTYEVVSESGPCHSKIFEVKCTLNDLKTNDLIESVVASGSSINKAKNSAAELVLAQTKLDKPTRENREIIKKKIINNKLAIKEKITQNIFNQIKYESDLDSYNKRQLLAKISQIQLDQKEHTIISSFVANVEMALKKVSDNLLANELNNRPNATEIETDKESLRVLEGVVRCGSFAKQTFLKSDRLIELAVLCKQIPSYLLVKEISLQLESELKKNQSTSTYELNADDMTIRNESCIYANNALEINSNATYKIKIMFTSLSLTNNSGGSEPKTDLSIDKCKSALTQIMRLKWFNAKLKPISNSVLVLGIVRDLVRRIPTWSVLDDWLIELIVDLTFSRNKYEEVAKKLQTFFEIIAGGCLLLSSLRIESTEHDYLTINDPCTNQDAFENVITCQQRYDLVASAQHALRLIVFKRINEVLAIDTCC